MRVFETGATRDNDESKPDYEGFMSPIVVRRYGEYMLKHQQQSDGSTRSSDNWQKGIPKDVYLKSLLRHIVDVWSEHRGYGSRDGLQDALCAIIFNASGYLFESLRAESLRAESLRADRACETCAYTGVRVDRPPCCYCHEYDEWRAL